MFSDCVMPLIQLELLWVDVRRVRCLYISLRVRHRSDSLSYYFPLFFHFNEFSSFGALRVLVLSVYWLSRRRFRDVTSHLWSMSGVPSTVPYLCETSVEWAKFGLQEWPSVAIQCHPVRGGSLWMNDVGTSVAISSLREWCQGHAPDVPWWRRFAGLGLRRFNLCMEFW